MPKDFYRAFEDRHRGSRELVKSRFEVYLPIVLLLKKSAISPKALDLGCGRCEWLELLAENGFDCFGVDLDEGMLRACTQRGLRAERLDALVCLGKNGDQSVDIISAFHVAEHLPFEKLQTLLSEALRVLKPGGLLLLETPNPENLIVGSKAFYTDPTHVKPLPPELLSFLAEYAGFFRVKIMRLQENKSLISSKHLSLRDVFYGASPDYCVVAQKQGENEMVEQFDQGFSKEYGITFDYLVNAYDGQIEARLRRAEAKAIQAEAKAIQAEAKAIQAEAKAIQAEARAQQAEAEVQSILRRRSIRAFLKRIAKVVIILLGRSVFATWFIAKPIKWTLRRFPQLHVRLENIVREGDGNSANRRYSTDRKSKTAAAHSLQNGPEQLSPTAWRIYQDLFDGASRKNKQSSKN